VRASTPCRMTKPSVAKAWSCSAVSRILPPCRILPRLGVEGAPVRWSWSRRPPPRTRATPAAAAAATP
jgi:hypothetical protein